MAWNIKVIFILYSVALPFSYSLNQASFYGNGFISIPLKEAKGSTDIYFKFRTHLPNALILLIAGVTDYCIVRIDNTRLKININLGSGEIEVTSSNSKLNDFKWHKVHISRVEANLTLQVDNKYMTKHLPGKFFELNINYGLFVGGHGNFSDLFFGHIENFRGCLAEVLYNGLAVLDFARHRQPQSIVQGVTWNCAAEFDASVNHPISFIEDKSFMAIQQTLKNLKWQFEVKTIVEYSILMYNQGSLSKQDYFSMEIWKGKSKVTLKSAEKVIEILNNEFVADGKWHKITLHFFPSVIELYVDSQMKSVKTPKGFVLNLHELFYIGGIEPSKRGRAMVKGLQNSDNHFKGCMQHLRLGDKMIGLKDALITEGLLPSCVWQFPCIEWPCENDDASCIQKGLDSYQCLCKNVTCDSKNSSSYSKGSLATDLELISVKPLQVIEGQNVLITLNNLHINLDYLKYGITDSGIIFHILEFPEHGIVKINTWPQEKDTFTFHDLLKDKVYYVHDGSEHHMDKIIMNVQFFTKENFILPAHLQGNFKFVVTVHVQPKNDPPVLNIPALVVLRVAQGKKKIITKEHLLATDSDTPLQQLVYEVVESAPGHFENTHKPEVPLSSFTQKDINDGKIVFVHNNSSLNQSYVSLQVSDGIEKSKVAKLRVYSYPQVWWLENNTGLNITYETAVVITPHNLSFISNDPSASEKTQYFILQPPKFGVIEIEKDVGVWVNTSTFLTEHLQLHRVRYRHTHGSPKFDEYQFKTALNNTSVYYFRITFIKCRLYQINNNQLILNNTEEIVTKNQINYQTEPLLSPITSIAFVITKYPQYGFLFFTTSKYHMRVGDLFTQADVHFGNIKYSLYSKAYSQFYDSIYFDVIAPGCKNITSNITVVHQPNDEVLSLVQAVLKPVAVEEGAKVNIESNKFQLVSDIFTDLIFNVTTGPRHGTLQINGQNVRRNNTNYFTLAELEADNLFYVHDDSETTSDSFSFMALSVKENFEYVDSYNITVTLKNDNSPIREIDKVFNVVIGSSKLITGNDMRYYDEDINTKPSDIVYSCREIPNGEIINLKNGSVKVTEFTQQDLDSGFILFKHKGPEHGKIKLWITDGKFYVNGVLEIKASAPFIRIFAAKKIIVQHAHSTPITKENLSYSTNLFATDEEVIYEVITKPSYGKITFRNDTKEVKTFSQTQINFGEVYYVHDFTKSNADELRLRVRCYDAVNEAQLSIWILPAAYWEPLAIKNLQVLQVEEATSALIDKDVLEVYQADVPAGALTYYITKNSVNGYLTILPNFHNLEEKGSSVIKFSQASINEKKIFYIQSVSNKTEDKIIFNVTNGLVWLNNLELKIIIIPENIYVKTNVVKVNEGGVVAITLSHLTVSTEYYKNKVTKYKVVEQPKHGCLSLLKTCNTSEFLNENLLKGVVEYQHDDSENLEDDILVVAVAGNKQSAPTAIRVIISPINDQIPKVINNTGATIWEGSTIVLTNSMLASIDNDRPLETLRYKVVSCWWGNVSLVSDADTLLQFFTQDLINRKLVAFRHKNGSETKFVFTVSDGVHTTEEFDFYIKTRPVKLHLNSQMGLHVFPLQKKLIKPNHILTIVSDFNRPIDYEIIKAPALGRLIIYNNDTNVLKVINSFTQEDINSSRVFYEHTHPFLDLYANDSFIFNVKSYLATPLLNQEFKIDISVSSGGLDAYIDVPKIIVEEGGMANIRMNLSGIMSFLETHAGLKSPVIHASFTTPQFGYIFLKHNSNLTTFTGGQLESGHLYYQHDHSDSLFDNVFVSLYLIPGYILLSNISVPIKIDPINDQPFALMTPMPHLIVVQGENYTITNKELLTEDKDTFPQDIRYDVISGPSEGQLLLLPDLITINHFSQQEINSNKILYKHNGTLLKDSFHLRVWDGKFRPEYTIFNIQAIPINLNVSVGLPAFIQQGLNVVLLSEKLFFIDTNTDKRKIQFLVRELPKHGALYVKDSHASLFTYVDLEAGNVMYMQTDMTTANDSFAVFAGILLGNISVGNEVQVFIKVQPLMQISDFTVVAGKKNRLTTRILDATPLAKMTSSNPRYTIVKFPLYGQIRKIIRSSGEKRNVLDNIISSFSHEEVQSGLIYLVVSNIDIGWDGLYDKLEFILTANIFQPALGTLKISIRSSSYSVHSTISGPNDPEEHEGPIHISSPNITRDYFVVVSMVVGVVILGIAVIIIIKCRTLESRSQSKQDQAQIPVSLPRPPERLMSSSSSIKQQNSEGFVSVVPTTLPHCKVTPLSRDELETRTHYPYGIEEQIDDWSSCDASDPSGPARSNVMLRRNQYWV